MFGNQNKEEKSKLQEEFETFTEGLRAFLGRDPIKRTVEKTVNEFVETRKEHC